RVAGGAEGPAVDGVEASGALGADGREAAVAEHLQVLRDRGLGDAELGPHDRGDRARGQLTLGEQLQDATANRIAEDVERVHAVHNSRPDLYKSTLWFRRDRATKTPNGA